MITFFIVNKKKGDKMTEKPRIKAEEYTDNLKSIEFRMKKIRDEFEELVSSDIISKLLEQDLLDKVKKMQKVLKEYLEKPIIIGGEKREMSGKDIPADFPIVYNFLNKINIYILELNDVYFSIKDKISEDKLSGKVKEIKKMNEQYKLEVKSLYGSILTIMSLFLALFLFISKNIDFMQFALSKNKNFDLKYLVKVFLATEASIILSIAILLFIIMFFIKSLLNGKK